VRFKIDENLSESVRRFLLDRGHDCHSVHDEGLGGSPDADLLAACGREKRHLITLDLDFADIITYPPGDWHGILVLRLSRQDPLSVITRLRMVLQTLEGMEMPGHLVIVSDHRLRYR